MAGSPTVQEIIKKREADTKSCEATANAERAKIENSFTLNLPATEYAKGLFLYGPSGLKASLLAPIQGDEAVLQG